jgi:hypothetical protein
MEGRGQPGSRPAAEEEKKGFRLLAMPQSSGLREDAWFSFTVVMKDLHRLSLIGRFCFSLSIHPNYKTGVSGGNNNRQFRNERF